MHNISKFDNSTFSETTMAAQILSFTLTCTHLLLSILLLTLPIILIISRYKSRNLPPGPRPWPIVGNLFHIGAKPHIALARLAKEHGPLISVRLGSQLVVVGSTPAAAAEILKTQDRLLSGRHVPHVSYAKNPDRNHASMGWTFECTSQWKFLRTLCKSELLGTKTVDGQSGLRERKVRELIAYLGSKDGEAVKIGEAVFVGVFNFLGNLLFSRDFIGFEDEGEEGMIGLVRRMVELWTAPNVSDLYPILGGFDLQGLRRKVDECVKMICGVWEGIIRERRETKGPGPDRVVDFLDVTLQHQFSDDQINCLFLELLAAGTDTSTSTVEWTLAELMKNPEAMSKIVQELDESIPPHSSYVSESHIPSLTYLQACVKETLRLHPPAPLLLPRRATETCEVMGYTVPKDTQVLVNVWAIGRDPAVWDDPLSFKPERFLSSDVDFKGNDFEFLPFGAGRRICPGLVMAARQVCLTLASLLYCFEWSLPRGMAPEQLDMGEKFGVTLQKEIPLALVPVRRNI